MRTSPFTPADLAEIQAIAALLNEMHHENPSALLPASAERLYLAEQIGLEWDFDEGRLQPADNGITYRPTARALTLLGLEGLEVAA